MAYHRIPTGEEYITSLARWDAFTDVIGVTVGIIEYQWPFLYRRATVSLRLWQPLFHRSTVEEIRFVQSTQMLHLVMYRVIYILKYASKYMTRFTVYECCGPNIFQDKSTVFRISSRASW